MKSPFEKQIKEIIDLCADVEAYSEMDYEITLGGNGANASECSYLAGEIINILKIDENIFSELVNEKIKQLKEEIGESEDEEENE